jgi:glycosyltransferase involved in cell wall biosynthesis
LIPAYNESTAIGSVVREVRSLYPSLRVIVCDDCSTDGTPSVATAAGAEVVHLPCHLGLGGCIQTGYRLAYDMGIQAVVRIDGDGQHDPADIPRLLEVLQATGFEMAIGVRPEGAGSASSGLPRSIGSSFFKLLLRPILGRPVADPTSGFVAVNAGPSRFSATAFHSIIRRLRPWQCCSAVRSGSRKYPFGCGRGSGAEQHSRG